MQMQGDGAWPIDETRPAITSDGETCDFLRAAENFADVGIAAIPTRLDDCKRPKIKRPGWHGVSGALEIAQKHPFANVGFMCGPRNGITVVDIDSPALSELDWARQTFGDSPVLVGTASGKYHLYYGHSGELRLIRPFAGHPIDVLGAGLCVAPPSIRPGMGRYQFIGCDYSDLRGLPPLLPGALARVLASAEQPASGIPMAMPNGLIMAGERNNQLFLFGLGPALAADELEAFVALLHAENAKRCVPPLDDAEVRKIAGSIWRLKLAGNLFPKGEQRLVLKGTTITPMFMGGDADALLLHALLNSKHFTKGKVFAIAANAMAEARVLGIWSADHYRKARRRLIELGILIEVHRGGRGKGDPSLFRFADGAIH